MALNVKDIIPSSSHPPVTEPVFDTSSKARSEGGEDFDINKGSREKALGAWREQQKKKPKRKNGNQLLDVL
tara:strand:+ start:685 stop:897 length:213 start_codon:yes stop_codon:yes gene_type:complete